MVPSAVAQAGSLTSCGLWWGFQGGAPWQGTQHQPSTWGLPFQKKTKWHRLPVRGDSWPLCVWVSHVEVSTLGAQHLCWGMPPSLGGRPTCLRLGLPQWQSVQRQKEKRDRVPMCVCPRPSVVFCPLPLPRLSPLPHLTPTPGPSGGPSPGLEFHSAAAGPGSLGSSSCVEWGPALPWTPTERPQTAGPPHTHSRAAPGSAATHWASVLFCPGSSLGSPGGEASSPGVWQVAQCGGSVAPCGYGGNFSIFRTENV